MPAASAAIVLLYRCVFLKKKGVLYNAKGSSEEMKASARSYTAPCSLIEGGMQPPGLQQRTEASERCLFKQRVEVFEERGRRGAVMG